MTIEVDDTPNVWQIFDESNGLLFPYYTHGVLRELSTWDISKWRVFEYGGGLSTRWWREKAKECISVDTSPGWSEKMDLVFTDNKKEFVEYPLNLCQSDDDLFDCIIIDGEPAGWRDSCTSVALRCLKAGGKLIIDNWLQDSIPGLGTNDWGHTKEILKSYECNIYGQHNHDDWKTAVWVIE